jgi:integrase/recombinase XerD
MSNLNLIGSWIRRFLLEHIVGERNLARHTQTSYRDALTILLPFVAAQAKKTIDQLTIDHVSPEVVRRFLTHLEENRGCSLSTRNQRLAALHALARFISHHSPEHLPWCTAIRLIPFKRTGKPATTYLEKNEMDALLNAPNRQTEQGLRDYALLLFLYNSGARADEAARLTVADLQMGSSPFVKILGKGSKTRLCPLWPLTANTVSCLISSRPPTASVFLNRRRQPITRFGIRTMVKRYAVKVSGEVPSLQHKRISTHTIRHTTAVHLLRAGVDINTIRAWLGHVSLDTTHIYAEVDLEMKAKALAHCELFAPTPSARWHNDQKVMAFLKGL